MSCWTRSELAGDFFFLVSLFNNLNIPLFLCGPMSTLPSPCDGNLRQRTSQRAEAEAGEPMPIVLRLDKRNETYGKRSVNAE
jgi:hypothetical protein